MFAKPERGHYVDREKTKNKKTLDLEPGYELPRCVDLGTLPLTFLKLSFLICKMGKPPS